ncbi:T9SS type A sorting domain-containing protein [Spirosoma koreense]
MQKTFTLTLLAWIIFVRAAMAQTTPFSASWSFEGDLSGASSTSLVTASSATLANVLVPNVGGYPAGQVGRTVNLQNWTNPACPGDEYLEIKISPAASVTMVLTTLSFFYSRSTSGPNTIRVKSSLDGYSTDIYTSSITATGTPYQSASINLTSISSAFASQTQPVSFRFYGCDRNAINGTMRLDEIRINATALPVTLLSFTAKPEGDRVQLAWATTMERDADRFVVDRSSDLKEFVRVGELPANGTTDERQYYGLTDFSPLPGINYYRLTQLDYDGTPHDFKPVSAIIRVNEPVVAVFPNPADPTRIHLRLWKADDAPIRLLTPTGQVINFRLERRQGEADLLFDQPLSPGLYWVEVLVNGQKSVVKIIVR